MAGGWRYALRQRVPDSGCNARSLPSDGHGSLRDERGGNRRPGTRLALALAASRADTGPKRQGPRTFDLAAPVPVPIRRRLWEKRPARKMGRRVGGSLGSAPGMHSTWTRPSWPWERWGSRQSLHPGAARCRPAVSMPMSESWRPGRRGPGRFAHLRHVILAAVRRSETSVRNRCRRYRGASDRSQPDRVRGTAARAGPSSNRNALDVRIVQHE